MKNTLRNIIGAGALTLATALSTQAQEAREISGNFKYVENLQNSDKSYPEFNAFYTLPGEINGYTWGDISKSGNYFGKTNLDREVAKIGKVGLNAAVQVVQADKPLADTGFGLKFNIPVKNGYGSVGMLPAWRNNSGGNPAVLTFSYGKDLGYGLNFETFGEVDVRTKMGYGELELTKKLGPLKIGPLFAMNWNGDAMPKFVPRVAVRYDFKTRVSFWKK